MLHTPRPPALEPVTVPEVLPPLLHWLQHPCPKVVDAHLLTRGDGVSSMHHLQTAGVETRSLHRLSLCATAVMLRRR